MAFDSKITCNIYRLWQWPVSSGCLCSVNFSRHSDIIFMFNLQVFTSVAPCTEMRSEQFITQHCKRARCDSCLALFSFSQTSSSKLNAFKCRWRLINNLCTCRAIMASTAQESIVFILSIREVHNSYNPICKQLYTSIGFVHGRIEFAACMMSVYRHVIQY
jgi:hypothetical protein